MVHLFHDVTKKVFIPTGILKVISKAQLVIDALHHKLLIQKMCSKYLQIVNSSKNLNINKLFK